MSDEKSYVPFSLSNTTPPSTGATTAVAYIDDDVSITSVRVDRIAPPPNQDPERNIFSGYNFYVRITVFGEHLDLVDVRQDIRVETHLSDSWGDPLDDPQDVLNIVHQQDPNAPADLVNTAGDDVRPDPLGNWANWQADLQVIPGTKNGQAVIGDNQSFGLPVDSTQDPNDPAHTNIEYTYLASRSVTAKTQFKKYNSPDTDLLGSAEWYYTWTNDPCRATTADMPWMPTGWVGAASNKNGGKGEFLDTNISGLTGLN